MIIVIEATRQLIHKFGKIKTSRNTYITQRTALNYCQYLLLVLGTGLLRNSF